MSEDTTDTNAMGCALRAMAEDWARDHYQATLPAAFTAGFSVAMLEAGVPDCADFAMARRALAGPEYDEQRALGAVVLAMRERIGVLPGEGDRTDWCGYMTRKRDKRKGFDSWTAYAPTPAEAIEAVWAEFLSSANTRSTSEAG